MIINQPSFLDNPGMTSPDWTILRFTNVVTDIQQARAYIISGYLFTLGFESKFKYYEDILEKNKNLTLIIDSTTELFSGDVRILTNSPYADRIVLISNGTCDRYRDTLLKHSKVRHKELSFFIKYNEQYIADFSTGIDRPNDYLFLTGKPTPTREALLTKLHQKGLLSYGNISYFGKEVKTDFTDMERVGREWEYWKFYSKEIDYFKSKLEGNMVLDVEEFDYTPSHSRYYNGKLYTDVDFVIVTETDLFNEKILHTEKSIKPVQINKKFILVNKPGALADLKEKFLTYHNRDISDLTDWIDVSYDTIEDLNERLDYIVKLISKYLKVEPLV